MARIARQNLPKLSIATNPKLVAVVPAFNEAGNIAKVITELKNLRLEGLEIEFVVVDDGSTDNTAEIAKAHGAEVIQLPYNMGIGLSVQTGFQFALSRGANYVVQVDGDGQHIPEEISKLLSEVRNGCADMALGSRFVDRENAGRESTTFLRWLAGRGLSRTIGFLTGQRFSDTTSGFRLFNREAAEYVARHYPDDYPEVQVLVSLKKRGYKIKEVAVQMRSREHGQSSINWWRSIYYMGKVVFASFMDRVRR